MTPRGAGPSIRIVSASAGSGKTHRLAVELERSLTARLGRVAPEAVVAVTFTNKAAAELAERARVHLLQDGKPELAHRLAAARLGTVHAVCGRLLDDFAFETGLSPELRVIDQDAAKLLARRALGQAFAGGEAAELAELAQRFDRLDLREVVRELVDGARGNGLAPGDLARSAERSRESLLAHLDPPVADGRQLDRELRRALGAFLAAAQGEPKPIQKTAAAVARVRAAVASLDAGGALPWDVWAALAQLESGAWAREAAEAVAIAARRYLAHPRLRADLARAIDLAFDLARRSLETYAAQKRALGVVDFTDQLVLARELLALPAVREQLAGELGLVLVDEFQDTNPLQLDLFLALAGLARRSVWVGDQKQAIYGFLGADPALMDAAIGAILGQGEPETLDTSYRSRPPLVALTSELFARAFAGQGLPESRVRLAASAVAVSCERAAGADLGPCLERWVLEAGNQGEDVLALAAGVAELLADPRVRVRDRVSGAARAVRPGDVAVLCRRNATCRDLAAALGRRGIRTALPRTGLLGTAEGQAARAALALWVEPRDAHAAATLARLADYPGDGDAWLADALARPRAAAFRELPRMQRLAAARAARPWADPVGAFEAALDAAGLRELCLAWGRSDERLANLDALRAAAVAYRDLCDAEGAAPTVAGLLARLDELAEAERDAWATAGGAEDSEAAVVLSTWHAAKGLEWPVTVLSDLADAARDARFGVFVEPAEGDFDFTRPLTGRWLRYWPNPFGERRTRTGLHERIAEDPAAGERRRRADREALRLLYVGWTRARDLLVLAGRAAGRNGSPLARGTAGTLAEDGEPLLAEPDGDVVRWAGQEHAIRVRRVTPVEAPRVPPTPGEGYVATGPRQHPPARLSPSGANHRAVAATDATGGSAPTLEKIGESIAVQGEPDAGALGSAIHRFLAADDAGTPWAERIAMAAELLRRWEIVVGTLDPADLVRAADGLGRWLESIWPGARRHREWPLAQRLGSGTVVAGNADLVLEVDGGLVLVDHKLLLGPEETLAAAASTFAPQLAAYAAALTAATGRPVLACLVHLPLHGVVVRLEVGETPPTS